MQPTIRQYYHLEELWGDKPVKLNWCAGAAGQGLKAERKKRQSPPRGAQAATRCQSANRPATYAKPAAKKAARTDDGTLIWTRGKTNDWTAKRNAAAQAVEPAVNLRHRSQRHNSDCENSRHQKGSGQKSRCKNCGQTRSQKTCRTENHDPGQMRLTIVAVGQKVPDWAQTAYDDYAKRFPPELKVELKAVKTEPRASKTLENLLAAERQRIESVIPKGTRIVALDERGQAVTTWGCQPG